MVPSHVEVDRASRVVLLEIAVNLEAIAKDRVPVDRLVAARFPLDDGLAAFERAGSGGVLKVIVEMPDR